MVDEPLKPASPVPPAPIPALAVPKPVKEPERVEPVKAGKTYFAGFPKIKYHPVKGAVTVDDPNEEAALYPKHDYFDTPGEADMHRTDREAMQVVHHNTAVKVAAKLEDRMVDLDDDAEAGRAGVVRNSVQATENLNAGNAEPL